MNCTILSVGTELLIGQITNTNSVYLSKQLNLLGINVLYHFTVGDNKTRLGEILKYSIEKTDIIITTGGLGPTQDDLTKETISAMMDRSLIKHESSYKKLHEIFKKLNRSMTDNNLKQVYLPENSIVLENNCGTAPGFMIENDGKVIISLPGPPKEMISMFESGVKKYLESKTSAIIYSKILRIFGIGESELESILYDLIDGQSNPTVATYAKEGEVSLRITSKAQNEEQALEIILPVIEEIKKRVGKYIYSYDNEELHEAVAKILSEKGISLSLAESCTGGLLASKLTEVPGISVNFDRCIVTYSNLSKIEELGVKKETLDNFGAVSEETAKEMISGLKRKVKSGLHLAITGIAGPDGGSDEKPVGLVYIALEYKGLLVCQKFNILGGRERIRNNSCLQALNMIRRIIIEN